MKPRPHQRALAYIEENPGASLKDVGGVLNSHHGGVDAVVRLKQAGAITEAMVGEGGGRRCMFFVGRVGHTTIRRAILRRYPLGELLHGHVEANPGTFCSEIARAYPELCKSTVDKTLQKLSTFGFLRREKPGKIVRFYAIPVDAPISQYPEAPVKWPSWVV